MDFSLANLRYYYDLIGSYTSLLTKIAVWAVRLTYYKNQKNESQKNTTIAKKIATKLKKHHKTQKN